MNDTLRAVAGEEWAEYEAMTVKWSDEYSVVTRASADAIIAKLVAAVEERDRMLRLAFRQLPDDGLEYSELDYEMWLGGLHEDAAQLSARDRKEQIAPSPTTEVRNDPLD